MSSLLATLPAVVPEGPLHPGLAVGGIVVGVSAAAMAGRSTRTWSILVVLGAWVVTAAVHGDWLVAAFTDRPDRGFVIGTTAAALVAAVAIRPQRSTATVISLSTCVGVWAVVPDTEAALAAGGVLVGAAALTMLPGWLADSRRHVHGILVLLPLVGAAVGSVGRPARFGPGMLVGALTALAGVAAWRLLLVLWRRQWAGTPTTVVPGSTSSMTTAPAPTTAS